MQVTLDEKKINTSSFGIALCLHVILLLLLIITFQFKAELPALKSGPQIIQATVITQAPLSPAPPSPPKQSPPATESIKAPPVKNKPIVKPVPDENVVKFQAKKAAADLALKKQLEAKKVAELKRQTELKKRLEAQKKQKLAEQKLLQQQQENLLQQQLAQEQQQISAAKAQELQGIVDKYKALIVQAIAQAWPHDVTSKMFCVLKIHLAPDGTVLEVSVSKSSGNDAFDQSAVTAVNKASPLPVPSDSQAFATVRDLTIKMNPQGITT